jgi:enamine deaminase RidA (YjgF/YER057c/UK114 family)
VKPDILSVNQLGRVTVAPSIEAQLKELGLTVPEPPNAIGNFVPGVVHKDVLYVSGTYGTIKDSNGSDYIPKPGKVGAELTVEDGYESARWMLLNHLALARAVLHNLDRIERPIRLVGYVNAAPGFNDAPSVLNGASDLLIAIFGEQLGCHARMALYQHELARDAPIAGEISFALKA